jgi:hypothetical protein
MIVPLGFSPTGLMHTTDAKNCSSIVGTIRSKNSQIISFWKKPGLEIGREPIFPNRYIFLEARCPYLTHIRQHLPGDWNKISMSEDHPDRTNGSGNELFGADY